MFMRFEKTVALAIAVACSLHAETVTMAVAPEAKYAVDAMAKEYEVLHPADKVNVVVGNSDNMYAQIVSGAPIDLFFAADMDKPSELVRQGLGYNLKLFGVGKLSMVSTTIDDEKLSLKGLVDPSITKVVMVNPANAPEGVRAQEALRSAGVLNKIADKIIYAESAEQAERLLQTGAAQVGILESSHIVGGTLAVKGFLTIHESMYESMDQGCVITMRAKFNHAAQHFADFATSSTGRAIVEAYGYSLPVQFTQK